VKGPDLISRVAETLAVVLLGAALGLMQVLIGGTRLIFSLPAYAIIALVGLLTVFSLRKPKPRPAQLCLLSSAIFFGYILVRAFFSPVAYIARPDVYSVLGGLVVYLFVACIGTSAKSRSRILFFLLALALVHILIGAIQFRDGNNFMPIPFLQRFDYGRRASGFYVCPNHLAGLLEVLGIFGVSLVCWSRFPTWSKLLIAYATGVCYLGILLTGSRGGYASTATSLIAFAILSLIVLRRAGTPLLWRIGGIGLLAALILGGSAVFVIKRSDFLASRTQNAFDTVSIRLDCWHAAIGDWKAEPVLGTGSGTYLYYGRKFRAERMQQDPIDAHNDYLHLLAEYGAVGGLFLLFFLGTHLQNGWKNFKRLGPKRVAVAHNLLSTSLALNLGALGAVAAYLVHSFVDFNLHIPANVLLVAFVFGILANAGIQRDEESTRVPTSIWWWRSLLPILGLVLAIQCFRLLPGEYFAERARTAQRDNHPDIAMAFALRGLATEHQNPYLYQYLSAAEFTRCDSMSDPQARSACYQEPIAALEQAWALTPQDRNVLVKLGLAYDGVGRHSEAEWMFYDAKQWDPKSIYLNEIYKYHLSQWQAAGAQSQSAKP
jgi:O-antigen ligase